MFKLLITGFVLVCTTLTACAPPSTSTPPRVMKLSNIPRELDFTLRDGCKYKTAEFNVFGQKAQTLSFKYQQCKKTAPRQFALIGNNEVIDKETGKSLLVVGKQGPDTEKEYMEKMAQQADPDKCTVLKTPEDFWVLIGESYNSPYSARIVGFQPEAGLYETKCDHYEGFWRPKGWVFKFEEGIVFGVRLETAKNVIDLSSITYTSSG